MTFNLSRPNRTIHAGVILTGGVTEMIDVAPFELFAWMDKKSLEQLGFPQHLVDQAIDLKLHWVTEDGSPGRSRSGANIQATDSFSTCPPLDIALMGAHSFYKMTEGEKAFVAKTNDDCSAFLSICGGIFAMREAGILDGKTVSAPRMTIDAMRREVPKTNWVDKRWVHDGKIWSSSSLLNGTDLMRAFAEQTWGPERGGMIEALLDAGHWPCRDVEFKDFHGTNFQVDRHVAGGR